MKVALFKGIGGFNLSHTAIVEIARRKGWHFTWYLDETGYMFHANETIEYMEQNGGMWSLKYYIDYVWEVYKEGWFFPNVDYRDWEKIGRAHV